MKRIPLFLAALVVMSTAVFAGDFGIDSTVTRLPEMAQFNRGVLEVEGGAGFFGSFSTTSAKRETINYQLEDLRIGWMYDVPRHDNWGLLRGNNEFLVEIFGGPVTKGPGSYLAGFSPLWRYNFVQPDAHIVPYLQLGAGALSNDIWKSRSQREVGENFEFVLQADFGIRYLINDQWSVSMEGDFRHISNADLASRNEGLNSIGGLMLMSYRFH
jgi:lipid A 3-O-deacylase